MPAHVGADAPPARRFHSLRLSTHDLALIAADALHCSSRTIPRPPRRI